MAFIELGFKCTGVTTNIALRTCFDNNFSVDCQPLPVYHFLI